MHSSPRKPRQPRVGKRIFLMTPWGQMAVMDFSVEELDLVDDLIEMTGETFEQVVTDVARDRFYTGFGIS